MDLVIEASLEALIHKATDPRNKGLDNSSTDAFCSIVKNRPEFSYLATKQVVAKIQSSDEWEAVQGLALLDSCMKNCGPTFHSEVGKFRFLNELIKIISPKYLGDKTSPKVRDMAVRLIHSWTIVYTKEPKIRDAYDMLKQQGVVPNDIPATPPKPAPPPKQNIPVDHEFENRLKKLLSSKNPDDLEAANRMIKSRVMETERRSTDLERIRTNVRLLSEMLSNYQGGDVSPENAALMAEVHTECEKLRPLVFRLAGETYDGEALADVLNLSEELSQVFENYRAVIGQMKVDGAASVAANITSPAPQKPKSPSALLDLSSPVRQPHSSTAKPCQDLLGSESPDGPGVSDKSTSQSFALSLLPDESPPVVNNMDHLGAIFDALNTSSSVPIVPNAISPNNYGQNILALTSKTSTSPSTVVVPVRRSMLPVEKTKKQKALEELDILGESLLQQCKNDIQQSRESSVEPEKIGAMTEKVDDELTGLVSQCQSDEIMLGTDEISANGDNNTGLEVIAKVANGDAVNDGQTFNNQEPILPVRPLTDLTLTLEKITPSQVPPLQILKSTNGVTITVHVAQDAPRDDVTVYVVTTTSTSNLPITDYLFQIVVPKKCKFKLQVPSSTVLPAHNPFLPPSAITQILLIANPYNLKMHLTFMLSFTMDDETVTEVGEVLEMPTILK